LYKEIKNKMQKAKLHIKMQSRDVIASAAKQSKT